MAPHPMLREPVTAYIALGANLGDAKLSVSHAMMDIARLPSTAAQTPSALYSSAPIDSCGTDYINAVMMIKTLLPAYSLLKVLQNLEQKAGRERPYMNAPRTLDLDLVLFGSGSISSDVLTVPHPRMLQRAFVLAPLHEIAPELVSAAQLQAVQAQRIVRLPSYQP